MLNQVVDYLKGFWPVYNSGEEWLPPQYDGFLWQLELLVANKDLAFNADALWDPKCGGESELNDIVEARSLNPKLRLCQALHDHRYHEEAKTKKKFLTSGKCFTDIIVCLSESLWIHDLRITGGKRIKALAQILRQHHASTFARIMPSNRSPRYLIRIDPKLSANSLIFLFGIGVHIPTSKEQPVYYPLITINGSIRELSIKGEGLEQAAGFYTNQSYMLLTPEGLGPTPVPGWHGSNNDYLLICYLNDNWEAMGDKHGVIKTFIPYSDRKSWIFERYSTYSKEEQILSLEIAPTTLNYTQIMGITSTENTLLTSKQNNFTLNLEALLLPELQKNITNWSLWLNTEGILATPEQIRQAQHSLVKLTCNAQGIILYMPGEPQQKLGPKITHPMYIGTTDTQLLPSPTENSLGLLKFAHSTIYPLHTIPQTLGRTNYTDGSKPDIALDQLAQQEYRSSPEDGYTVMGQLFANLCISRKQAQVRVNETGELIVEPHSKGHVVQKLAPNYLPYAESTQNISDQITLKPNECLLAGQVLLRFKTAATDFNTPIPQITPWVSPPLLAFQTQTTSLIGPRTENQDNYMVIATNPAGQIMAHWLQNGIPQEKPHVEWSPRWMRLAVMDGMGGHENGREISETVALALRDLPPCHTLEIQRQALLNLHHQLQVRFAHGTRSPGTTLIWAEVDCYLGICHLIHLGDSRAWLGTKHEWRRLTWDHTTLEFSFRDGRIDAATYLNNWDRPEHRIAQALGYGSWGVRKDTADGEITVGYTAELRMDTPETLPPQARDHADNYTIKLPKDGAILLLASDGLWNGAKVQLPDPTQITTETTQILAQGALAVGGQDNTTLVLGIYKPGDSI